MGQYWIPVNLDKREYINPHALGSGLKLWEQLVNNPGVGAALIILQANMVEKRGGGDLMAHDVTGRWAGDRVALFGDYAEDSDIVLKEGDPAPSAIYSLCDSKEGMQACMDHYLKIMQEFKEKGNTEQFAEYQRMHDNLKDQEPFTDITHLVAEAIESELDGKYKGDGWRDFVPNHGETEPKGMKPDMVIVNN